MSATYTIGEVAQLSRIPTKTIRYYEEVGLLRPAKRAANGYRVYDERSVHVLRFISRARSLGFPLKDVADLLALWGDKRRTSARVKQLAQAHIGAIERKLAELETMRSTLKELVHRCHGDDRPDCPILDDLGQHGHC